jgi:hypothetical protein
MTDKVHGAHIGHWALSINHCSSQLLLLDNGVLRERAERELARYLERIRKLEEDLDEFARRHLPGFRRWAAAECADLIAEEQGLREEIGLVRKRLSAIEDLERDGEIDPAAAYFWSGKAEEEEVVAEANTERAWEEHGFSWGTRESGATEESGVHSADDGVKPDRKRTVLQLYRKIVRQLHPDVAGAWTGDEQQLWLAAQVAYEQSDACALETILARCDRAGTRVLDYSELRGRVKQAVEQLLRLREVLREKKQHRAWIFLARTEEERRKLRCVVRAELESDIEILRRDLAVLQMRLERYRNAFSRSQARRRPQEQLLLF